MIHRIKIYGERNTNTNYMSKLIDLNLIAKEVSGVAPQFILKLQRLLPGKDIVKDIYFFLTYRRNLGWKHTLVKPLQRLNSYGIVNEYLYFITITKNPYSWLISLHRNPYHQYYSLKPSFEEFLQTPWKTIGRDNIKLELKSPIELWNLKNKSYLQLKGKKSLQITTESIFENPNKIIDDISSKFSIPKKHDKFVNFERSTKDKNKNSNYYRQYYLAEKWREKLSDEAISIINASVDTQLMQHFGYHILL